MTIDGISQLYGIIGDPVSHSLSPAMHNAAFAELGLNNVYVPLPTKDVGEAITGLKALGFKGVSVTIPHKQTVIPFLDSTDPVAESGATLRTSIGVGTGDSPQFTGVELGHATDTTLTRASSGNVNIEGNLVYRAGGTDVPVADGGTGVSTLTDGGVLTVRVTILEDR